MLFTRKRPKQLAETMETLQGLYQQHLELAREARKNGDYVVRESHYQQAEYYLHRMNEKSNPGSKDASALVDGSDEKTSTSRVIYLEKSRHRQRHTNQASAESSDTCE